jgi:hypothetical protein
MVGQRYVESGNLRLTPIQELQDVSTQEKEV